MDAPSTDSGGAPRGRNWLIVVVAVVVFCCLMTLCCGLLWSFYVYGDQWFGLAARLTGGLA